MKTDFQKPVDEALTDAQIYALYQSASGNLIDYDAAGNLISDKDGYLYTYDYENRIVKVQRGDGDDTPTVVAEFTYDALGRRIMKYDAIAADSTYYYYNDQWQVLMEYGADDAWDAYNIYGNYIDETLFRGVNGVGSYLYAHDHLYNTTALVTYNGSIAERYEYNAYGDVQILDSDFLILNSSQYANPYTFTGRRLDTLDNGNLSLMYYRNRYTKPAIGRFMTHDPLGINLMNFRDFKISLKSQYFDGLNIYGYSVLNPINRLDPLGYKAAEFPMPTNGEKSLVQQKCFKMPQFGQCSERAARQRDKCYDEAGDRYDAAVQAIKKPCYSVCSKRGGVWRRMCERGCDVSLGSIIRTVLFPEYVGELAGCSAIYSMRVRACGKKYTYMSYCGPLNDKEGDDFCVNTGKVIPIGE